MSSVEPAAETRAARRAQRVGGSSGSTVAAPTDRVENRPRPVVAASTVVVALALALASLAGSHAVVVGVLVLGGLLVAAGLPLLSGIKDTVASSIVLAATLAGLGATLLLQDSDPHLELTPIAVGGGIILACLTPLVRSRVREQLTPWLATTFCGIGLLLCGTVYAAVVADGRAPLLVAAVAIAMSSLVDLGLERPRLHAWMLPVSMLVGAIAGLATQLVTSGQVLVWAALVGLLSAGVALSLRRLLSQQNAVDEPLGGIAAGAASVLVVGPVVLTLARTFLGQ